MYQKKKTAKNGKKIFEAPGTQTKKKPYTDKNTVGERQMPSILEIFGFFSMQSIYREKKIAKKSKCNDKLCYDYFLVTHSVD